MKFTTRRLQAISIALLFALLTFAAAGAQAEGMQPVYPGERPLLSSSAPNEDFQGTWTELQQGIDSAESGETITLGCDVTATAGDGPLTVPANHKITLNLNGHTIDRNLSEPAANGSVFVVNGDLTLIGSGVIKGGNTTGNGGGFLVNGTLTLNGSISITGNSAVNGGGVYMAGYDPWFDFFSGTITGNTASNNGGGVHMGTGGFFYMSGGAITANTATLGGGVFGRDEVRLGGTAMIRNNNTGNLYLQDGSCILLDPLEEGAQIGITMAKPGVFTASSAEEMDAACFFSDTDEYDVTFAGSGEGTLVTAYDISTWAKLQTVINQIESGGSIRLKKSLIATATDGPLTIPERKEVTLDLNGWTLNRGLNEPKNNGSAVVVAERGKLYLRDSVGTGTITGGNNQGDGGGVYVRGEFYLYAGTISGNHAKNGGGVYAQDWFGMAGGAIRDNTAEDGGGVYARAHVHIASGTIENNTAARGGGVYADTDGGSTSYFQIGTDPVITAPENGGGAVYLAKGSNRIRMRDTNVLNENVRIGVMMEEPGLFTDTAGQERFTLDNFFSEDPEYRVEMDGTNAKLMRDMHMVSVGEYDDTNGSFGIEGAPMQVRTGETVTFQFELKNGALLRDVIFKTPGGAVLPDIEAVFDMYGGAEPGETTTGTFVMPDRDVVVSGDFAFQRYLRFRDEEYEIQHGSFAKDKEWYFPGETVTVSLTPDTAYGYALQDFHTTPAVEKRYGGGPYDYRFEMPDEDVIIEQLLYGRLHHVNIEAIQEADVSAMVWRGGTLKPAAEAAWGEEVRFSADPEDGFMVEYYLVTYPDGEDSNQTETVAPDGFFTMPDTDVTVKVVARAISWAGLQKAIERAQSGTTITLYPDTAYNYTAQEGDTELTVTSGDITIDLNGRNLDRGLNGAEQSREDGSVIAVASGATLTLKDSSAASNSDAGSITGGTAYQGGGIRNLGTVNIQGINIRQNSAGTGAGVYNDDGASFTMGSGCIEQNTSVTDGGGIYNEGTVTISGGVIRNNYTTRTGETTGDGGGIYNAGTLTMTGGSITGNDAMGQGGGIMQSGTMNVSGSPTIKNNNADTGDNIYRAGNLPMMNVTGRLSDAELWVSVFSETGIITSGYAANTPNEPSLYFRSDNENCGVKAESGEAVLYLMTANIPYIRRGWNGSEVTETKEYTDSAAKAFPQSSNTSLSAGTYVLNETVTVNGRISLQGNTSLILEDGKTLTAKGIYIPQGSTLTIYGQSRNSGTIVSNPSGGAGIGGYSAHDNGNIVIHGGTIQATGYDHCAGIGSNDGRTGGSITIYAGSVTARGGSDGAAIGGGRNCDGGTITIYGGEITANGPSDSDCCENGAGIGGGNCGAGGDINIYGGTINAYSRDGAGIGGGDDGDGGSITINGGTISAYRVNQGQGARIGGGCDADGGTVIINGGVITADGGSGAGIGGGKGCTGGTVTINGGVINASGSYGIGRGESGSDVAITLNYTDETKENIRITTSSYDGPVTLSKHFQNDSGVYFAGGDYSNSELSLSTLTAWDGYVSGWGMLQLAIDALYENQTISLSQDITAERDDISLLVPSGREFTLDLKGHRIDRGLANSAAQTEGYVLKNEGSLTITDSAGGGEITGGNNIGDTGGILNAGTLTIESGAIHGNRSSKSGGGIYNTGTLTINGGEITGNIASGSHGGGIYNIRKGENGGTLRLNGGRITGNSAGQQGGGILIHADGEISVSGSPAVSENTAATGNNLYLRPGKVMNITGELEEDALISVTAEDLKDNRITLAITSGFADRGTAANFASDSGDYRIGLNEDGEAILGVPVAITFAQGDEYAEGSMEDENKTVAAGSAYAFPACGYTVENRAFQGWQAGGETELKQPEDEITVLADITVTAMWKTLAPKIMYNQLTLTGVLGFEYHVDLPEEVAESGGTMTFQVPHRADQTIALSSAGRDPKGYRVFECRVDVFQMADPITATFRYQDGETEKTLVDTYSVREYLESICDGPFSAEAKKLADAALAFGHYVQPFMARLDNWMYGVTYAALPYSGTVDADAARSGTARYAYSLTKLNPNYVRDAQFLLSIHNRTVMKVDVRLKAAPTETVTMTIDEGPVNPTISGKTYRVATGDIAINNMDIPYRVKMEIGDRKVFDITASPLSYVNTILNSGDIPDDEENALAALYAYWQAAYDYQGQ